VPRNPLAPLRDVPVLHWHGDSFDLPDGAELLASSPIYRHQAFRVGPAILALQFHAEMGEDPRFHAWVEQWPEAAVEAGSSPERLMSDHAAHGPNAVLAGRAVIRTWLEELDMARPLPLSAAAGADLRPRLSACPREAPHATTARRDPRG
jgi:GMP synthase (glutamine-hydrolysing)